MKNEKGITLIELLVAVVIIGIIIIPLLTIFTGTFSRTSNEFKGRKVKLVIMPKKLWKKQGYPLIQVY